MVLVRRNRHVCRTETGFGQPLQALHIGNAAITLAHAWNHHGPPLHDAGIANMERASVLRRVLANSGEAGFIEVAKVEARAAVGPAGLQVNAHPQATTVGCATDIAAAWCCGLAQETFAATARLNWTAGQTALAAVVTVIGEVDACATAAAFACGAGVSAGSTMVEAGGEINAVLLTGAFCQTGLATALAMLAALAFGPIAAVFALVALLADFLAACDSFVCCSLGEQRCDGNAEDGADGDPAGCGQDSGKGVKV